VGRRVNHDHAVIDDDLVLDLDDHLDVAPVPDPAVHVNDVVDVIDIDIDHVADSAVHHRDDRRRDHAGLAAPGGHQRDRRRPRGAPGRG
jgi:hypothetical protein